MANTKISALTNGNPAQSGDLIPVDRAGSNFSVTAGSAAALANTLSSPGYFFPDAQLFDCFDPSNINPATSQNITSWKQFYLPWNVTITRYRFQNDGGTYTGGFFYAGLYNSAGTLLFDIGKIDLSAGAGQYGPGAVNDPGTHFFDVNRNPINSVTLTPGWYYYAWGGSVSTGSFVFPQMGANNALWNEQINIDTVGIAPVAARWAHSSLVDIAGGHLPTSISTSGGAATAPANITFFC